MKKFLTMTVLAALATGAFADGDSYQYLYWQINPGDDNGPWTSYAALYATVDGKDSIGTMGDAYAATASGIVDGPAVTDMANWSGITLENASFYVELIDGLGDVFSRSEYVSYASLLAGGYFDRSAAGSGSAVTHTGAYTFSTWKAVPEPTSGVLLLFGLAALGLKRKRA